MAKQNNKNLISNNIPFEKKNYEILRKIAIVQHRTLRKTIQLAVNEYIARNLKELENKDNIMIG